MTIKTIIFLILYLVIMAISNNYPVAESIVTGNETIDFLLENVLFGITDIISSIRDLTGIEDVNLIYNDYKSSPYKYFMIILIIGIAKMISIIIVKVTYDDVSDTFIYKMINEFCIDNIFMYLASLFINKKLQQIVFIHENTTFSQDFSHQIISIISILLICIIFSFGSYTLCWYAICYLFSDIQLMYIPNSITFNCGRLLIESTIIIILFIFAEIVFPFIIEFTLDSIKENHTLNNLIMLIFIFTLFFSIFFFADKLLNYILIILIISFFTGGSLEIIGEFFILAFIIDTIKIML